MPCLDLYGRGYSDAPQTVYDSTLYTTQLAFLMQYLRWDKANVVGLSMGGGIAAAFTDQFPHLVDEGVGLIASAGLMEVRWSKLSLYDAHFFVLSRVKFLVRPNSCLPLLSKVWLQADLFGCVFSFSILIPWLTFILLSFRKSYIQRLANKNVPEQNVNDDIIEVSNVGIPCCSLPISWDLLSDRPSTICPFTRLQCCLVIISQRRSDKRSIIHLSFQRF